MVDIKIQRTASPKQKPAADDPLKFGTIYTDHMFMMDYDEGQGWHDARIVPYGDIMLSPAAVVLHYGQEMFEGMKAYKGPDGTPLLFRPEKNIQRSHLTGERLCIPPVPEDVFLAGLKELVKIDADWIPDAPATSLYVRPFLFGTDAKLGVDVSASYLFMIILSPSGPYYPEGLNPIKIWTESNYVRSIKGGLGHTKAGANYAASMKAQKEALENGFSQVLWLDGASHSIIEEVGSMNIFFKIGGKVITRELDGSILPGVTRDSVLALCRDWGVPVEEGQLTIQQVYEASQNGTLEEVFGTGTAAVISPVGELRWGDKTIVVNEGKIGGFTQKLYDELTGIQLGVLPDPHGWTMRVE